ncbi:Nuclear autoantigenic sperm protein [Tupaia chinensis]|uniref:Nuclear autoantigenic sperm protein n=1 Tax=Tupaia chinensis TaxID=246437 RepID=L9LDB3_TUPCH|nr:Nuclear autoantigenic sperm protein [Tupaia chinensis]
MLPCLVQVTLLLLHLPSALTTGISWEQQHEPSPAGFPIAAKTPCPLPRAMDSSVELLHLVSRGSHGYDSDIWSSPNSLPKGGEGEGTKRPQKSNDGGQGDSSRGQRHEDKKREPPIDGEVPYTSGPLENRGGLTPSEGSPGPLEGNLHPHHSENSLSEQAQESPMSPLSDDQAVPCHTAPQEVACPLGSLTQVQQPFPEPAQDAPHCPRRRPRKFWMKTIHPDLLAHWCEGRRCRAQRHPHSTWELLTTQSFQSSTTLEIPCNESEDKMESLDVDSEAEKLLGLGQKHLVMGDVPAAVNAFQEAVSLLETHCQLGLAYGYNSQCDEAVARLFSKSSEVIEKRMAKLNEQMKEAEGSPMEYEEEMEELEEQLPEIREKIEDAKEAQRSGGVAELALEATLVESSTSGFTSSGGGSSVSMIANRKPTDGASSSKYDWYFPPCQ